MTMSMSMSHHTDSQSVVASAITHGRHGRPRHGMSMCVVCGARGLMCSQLCWLLSACVACVTRGRMSSGPVTYGVEQGAKRRGEGRY